MFDMYHGYISVVMSTGECHCEAPVRQWLQSRTGPCSSDHTPAE